METLGPIFLAEDSPADVYLLREALKAHGVENELLVAEDGEAAMAFVSSAGQDGPLPKLFILDLNLPKVDGRTILKQLRGCPRFARSPIVILTSSDNPADLEAALQNGADRYVRKAASLAEFLDIGRVIKTMLRNADHE